MSETNFDAIVIGGGITGVSIARELSTSHSVCVLERESAFAFHTTGRSAATFLETYGGPQIHALTTGSRQFLTTPPEGFEPRLMTPRPLLQFAKPGREHVIESLYRDVLPLVPNAELTESARILDLFPPMQSDYAQIGMYEPGAMELDVLALHGGYVRNARDNGAQFITGAHVVGISHSGGKWEVATSDGVHRQATTIINASGAWADTIAELAGVRKIGIMPLLRSIFMVASPHGAASKRLPMLSDVDGSFYIKPEGEQFLCSPADETPSEPKNARADMLEIARAIDEINEATVLGVRSVTRSWGGLRNFVPDRNFVIGEDSQAPGFFWFAGQGGYGIQTAPASARLGASLVRGEGVPADLVERGLDIAVLSPHRAGMSKPVGR